ncbi:hypothetical protein [Roseibacillus ishigakijimensis]|uniref:Uncharacterized protein n=1 Tax=Roseibacillus ishigakijimensis TaxID=454146 RepID=A0A934RLL3_9BACT|nr:hypothetical protein [Roseibacillus ishigakijimensis]MBK1833020.1 hypothetical protein [Roseibacillus ishigakijimensis]
MPDSTLRPSHLREALRLGWGGAKSNLLPGALLWTVGLVLVIAYYQSPVVAQTFDHIGIWKNRYSPWFAMVSTALFGSLIPWLAQLAFLPRERRMPFRQVPWLFLFWALHGWQVDKLYELQAHVFGNAIDAATIVRKTLVDQFVWVPLLAVPQVLLSYLFIEHGLSGKRFGEALRRKSYWERAIPLMIANWVVWVPSVSLVYLFPLPLQLPLMNLILALWCLIISFFAKNG